MILIYTVYSTEKVRCSFLLNDTMFTKIIPGVKHISLGFFMSQMKMLFINTTDSTGTSQEQFFAQQHKTKV